MLLHCKIIDTFRQFAHVTAVEFAVAQHWFDIIFVIIVVVVIIIVNIVVIVIIVVVVIVDLEFLFVALLLATHQFIYVHISARSGSSNCRSYNWIIFEDTVVDGLFQCFG